MFDTPTFLGRDLRQMRDFAAVWYGNRMSTNGVEPISAIIWPSDFWAFINLNQQSLARSFINDLEACLKLNCQEVSFAAEWAKKPPKEAGLESLDDFMKDVNIPHMNSVIAYKCRPRKTPSGTMTITLSTSSGKTTGRNTKSLLTLALQFALNGQSTPTVH